MSDETAEDPDPTPKVEIVDVELEAPKPARPSAPSRSVIAGVVAFACVYELVADGINVALQEPVMPSVATGIGLFRGRAVAARLFPRTLRVGAMLGTGYAIGAVASSRVKRKLR